MAAGARKADGHLSPLQKAHRIPEVASARSKRTSWWSVVASLPCNAWDTGLTPRRGTKIPQTTEQLRLCAITRGPWAATKP